MAQLTSANSYRTILRASSIVGSASVINILAGLAKLKVAAVLLGPAGVGLIGLYQSLMQTAGKAASLGIPNSGTRQIAVAEPEGGADAVSRTRRALFWGTLLQATVGALLFWQANEWVATYLLDSPERATDVAWLALGVGLTVAAGAQMALLRGLRRIGEVARIQAGAAIIGAGLGISGLYIWGEQGLLAVVLVAPLATFLLGQYYVLRLERPRGKRDRPAILAKEWSTMAKLGLAFMISGLVTVAGHLFVKVIVQNELGSDALGQFQASWAIGMTYLSFVLGAMGTDFYPRLASTVTDREAAVRLVNEQTEVALLLCGPVLLGMMALAPWVIRLLYSAEFGPAADILRWQLFGDILKVICWPLGFILLATAAGKTFVLTQSLGIAVFIGGALFGVPTLGIEATGIAFIGIYLIILPVNYWLARRSIGFRWNTKVKVCALSLVAASLILAVTSQWSDIAAASLGLPLAASFALVALLRLAAASNATGKLAILVAIGKRLRNLIRARR